jgi:hypothetical protein
MRSQTSLQLCDLSAQFKDRHPLRLPVRLALGLQTLEAELQPSYFAFQLPDPSPFTFLSHV